MVIADLTIVVVPKHQYDSILRQLSAPIADISISRLKTRVSWGIEVPGDMEHIIYVWLDALVNYLTAVDYPFADMNPQIHIIGKDIIK
jgi:methionyl-tRNA synthetase